MKLGIFIVLIFTFSTFQGAVTRLAPNLEFIYTNMASECSTGLQTIYKEGGKVKDLLDQVLSKSKETPTFKDKRAEYVREYTNFASLSEECSNSNASLIPFSLVGEKSGSTIIEKNTRIACIPHSCTRKDLNDTLIEIINKDTPTFPVTKAQPSVKNCKKDCYISAGFGTNYNLTCGEGEIPKDHFRFPIKVPKARKPTPRSNAPIASVTVLSGVSALMILYFN